LRLSEDGGRSGEMSSERKITKNKIIMSIRVPDILLV